MGEQKPGGIGSELQMLLTGWRNGTSQLQWGQRGPKQKNKHWGGNIGQHIEQKEQVKEKLSNKDSKAHNEPRLRAKMKVNFYSGACLVLLWSTTGRDRSELLPEVNFNNWGVCIWLNDDDS